MALLIGEPLAENRKSHEYLATGRIENVRKGDVCTKSNAYRIAIENRTSSVSIALSIRNTTTGAVVFSDSNSTSQATQKTPYITPSEVPLHGLLDDAISPLTNAAARQLRRGSEKREEEANPRVS